MEVTHELIVAPRFCTIPLWAIVALGILTDAYASDLFFFNFGFNLNACDCSHFVLLAVSV
jgi:hypothetical protein